MEIEEKINIIKSISEELINEEELRQLFLNKEQPVAYDGFEPSGRIHIAQGLLRAITINKITSTGIKFKLYVADWFGLLNHKMGGDLEKIKTVGKYFIEVWKSSGLDLDNVEFVWASDFIKSNPNYWETVIKLSMNATVQRVLKCGQIMGREDSDKNPSSQILYPLMQATDIYHLGADIAQLGMDQRKVNMLARDIFPKIGLKPPIAIHHHMLLGLQFKETEGMDAIEKKIALKMSKSKPDTAIFMTDSEEEIKRKFNKAYCPEGISEDNPVLEYCKYIIFEKVDEFVVERPEKWGGNLIFKNYQELEDAFVKKEIHPMDLKQSTAKYINDFIEPVRKHFEEDEYAKNLLETVNSYYKK
jgi:tyrosyl-tRNA synthetase